MKRIAQIVLGVYKLTVSPIVHALGGGCRFHPCCSDYARRAFAIYPWWQASWLVGGRLLRCGPWHPGGPDPVPPPASRNAFLRGH